MKKLRIIAVIVIAAILVGLLFFLLAPSKTAEKAFQIKVVYKEDSEFNKYVLSTESTVVAENDKYTMTVFSKTAAVQILDKKTGTIYSTNPDAIGQTTEKLSNKASADSQLILHFMNSNNDNQMTIWNSNDECVDKSQYSFYKTDKGFGVNYFFGEQPEDIFVPEIMSVESYKKVSEKLDADNKMMLDIYYTRISLEMYKDEDSAIASMLEKYPALKENDIYLLQMSYNVEYDKLSKDLLRPVDELLKSGGYTEEDFKNDNTLKSNAASSNQKPGFSVAIEYELTDNGFKATVPKESLSYDKSLITVTDLEFLPNFESVGLNESAQMFVPDGSGAIINTNNGVNKDSAYRERIYGIDESSDDNTEEMTSEVYLPVFGQLRQNSGYLAIITSGDAHGYINASVSGDATNYNRVFSSFLPHAYLLQTSNAIEDTKNYVVEDGEVYADITVEYFLMSKGGSFIDLANIYRNYLSENKLINKSENKNFSLELQLIASAKIKTTVLGIPLVKDLALTDYAAMQNILDKLNDGGVDNIETVMLSWCNGGLNNSLMSKVKPLSVLGSKKELSALLNNNKNIYAGVNFLTVNKTLANKKYAVQDINTIAVSRYDLFLEKDAENYILSPSKLQSVVEKFNKSVDKYTNFVCDINSGKVLATDYNEENVIGRQKALELTKSSLKTLATKNELKFLGANAYVLAYADSLSEVPNTSSGKYIFNFDVPFLQTVLRGYIPYSSNPLNQADNFEDALLKSVETGAGISFKLMDEDSTVLVNSTEELYSVNFGLWYKQICSAYKETQAVFEKIGNSAIIEHSNDGKLAVTEYENGAIVYVNYSKSDIKTEDGVTVKARSFTVQ